MGDSISSTSVPTIQPWENSSSPYFLSNGDNPDVSLVVTSLKKTIALRVGLFSFPWMLSPK